MTTPDKSGVARPASAATWNTPATWQPRGDERGCAQNPRARSGACCAFHHWMSRLLFDPRDEPSDDDDFAWRVEIAQAAHSRFIADAWPGLARFRARRAANRVGLLRKSRAHELAASFIAHALGEAGCSADCGCPGVVEARQFLAGRRD